MYITLSAPYYLCRQDLYAEIEESEMEMFELKGGQDDVAARCEGIINRREFADEVREKVLYFCMQCFMCYHGNCCLVGTAVANELSKVKEAIDMMKVKIKEQIDGNGFVVDNQAKIGWYLAQLCRRIQPYLDRITDILHMDVTRVFSEFTGELKGI